VFFHPEGIALARRSSPAPEPVIDLLDFRPCSNDEQRPQALADLVREHGLRGQACVCVLQPSDYQLTQLEAPAVPDAEMRSAVRWRLKEFLTYRVEDAVVDACDIPPAKGRPGPRMMLAVAAPRRRVQAICQAVELAGLALTAIDIPEFALRNLAAQVHDQGGGVALVALSSAAGLITVTHDELLYLARGLEFGEQQLLANPAYADTLVLELQRSLDYYESQLATWPASRVLLAPTLGDRGQLLARMNEQMGLTSYAMELDQLVELRGEFRPELQARALYAVGAALRAEGAA